MSIPETTSVEAFERYVGGKCLFESRGAAWRDIKAWIVALPSTVDTVHLPSDHRCPPDAVRCQHRRGGMCRGRNHSGSLASLSHADYCYVLQHGQVVAQGPAEQLLRDEEMLRSTNLLHAHRHRHSSGVVHSHPHAHHDHKH